MNSRNYKKINIITAWITFALAFITYYLTVEPTVSLWDCGEFIASSYKLEVGHPPGAPVFMLLARFFALSSSSVQDVAFMINLVSVTASAFTILFLFWTITYFAEKLMFKKEAFNASNAWLVLVSGVVGSLAYAFSDTFWFSAVEAEVYASSSLFTAVVFWAILKWEAVADEKYADRWLVLIALLMGISIGVHLLNLLAIPAIAFIYYFKKYKTTKKGIFYAFMLSVLILAFVMYGIIQGFVNYASKLELLFVNSFGMPYNSGLFAFIILVFALLIFGIYFTYKKKKVLWNTVFTMITVILIGYSSFAVIMIRSYANPPMDENNPENVFALLSYLNREQYGSRPLFYGNYYDAEFERDARGDIKANKRYTYIPENGKYTKIEKVNPEYLYKSSGKTIFPRMYSRNKNHISAYQTWGGIEAGEKPSFSNNLKFFFKYQLGHMYFRYFMWNFAGRQNNYQSYGDIFKGNWISGIPFIDAIFLGSQKQLPDKIKNEKSRNAYYMLPFILGILGLAFSFAKDKKNASVIALLFFFTGIAIVMYLNQTPYQPRERDYAYAGSFYAFAIWIGLGVLAIFSYFQKKLNPNKALIISALLTIPIPILMAEQNWDDHDRSNRYSARDFAENYLNSCDKNAILFTYGDNDTFPLWYLQEVEGVRTDVKVVNLSLLGTDWYIDQHKKKTYEAEGVPFKMTHDKYREGKREAIYVTDDPEFFIEEKYEANYLKYQKTFNALKKELSALISKSEYSKQNATEFDSFKNSLDTLSFSKFLSIVASVSNKDFIANYKVNKENFELFYDKIKNLADSISISALPLQVAMSFMASDDEKTQLQTSSGERINYIPSKKLSLNVPWPDAAKNGRFTKKELAMFEKNIEWNLSSSYIYKNDMAVLEIIAQNNWKRPIYFATSVPTSHYNGLNDFLRLEGFALRLVPYKTKAGESYINTEIMYELLMEKAKWGNIDKENINIDNFIKRTVRIMDIRQTFALLAKALLNEGKTQKAVKVLDRCMEVLPEHNFMYDFGVFDIAEAYYQAGEMQKANAIIEIVYKNAKQYAAYYKSFSPRFKSNTRQERTELIAMVNQFANLSVKYQQKDIAEKLLKFVYANSYSKPV